MPVISIVFACIAAAIHVLFFLMESIFFMSPKVYKGFGIKSPEEAYVLKVSMYNQGFYNLFLAFGIFEGIYLLCGEYADAGRALVLFCSACMFLASLVLMVSKKGMLRGVLIQGLCPLIAVATYYFCR